MSLAKKVDLNQAEIVAAFRDAGASVECLHTHGRGVPDLIVGYRRHNLLVEVKNWRKNLTPDQVAWHKAWEGQLAVVSTIQEAMKLLEGVRSGN